MRYLLTYILLVFVLGSCSNASDPGTGKEDIEPVKKQNFFPVTSYLRGQLYEVRNKGINPLKYTIINNHTDSVWLKIDEFEEAVKEFLSPEIDSANLTNLFTEKNFLDQTIAAFTFTYDPTGRLPDSIKLKHWDVYIDPESNKVKRIYMVKEISKSTLLQLTWQNDTYCKIVSIYTDANGNSTVEKEEKITWDF